MLFILDMIFPCFSFGTSVSYRKAEKIQKTRLSQQNSNCVNEFEKSKQSKFSQYIAALTMIFLQQGRKVSGAELISVSGVGAVLQNFQSKNDEEDR